MAEVAKIVELRVRPDGTADLLVDGVEFPWDVSWDGVSIHSEEGELAKVTLTLLSVHAVTSLEQVPVNEPSVDYLPSVEIVGETEAPKPTHTRWEDFKQEMKRVFGG